MAAKNPADQRKVYLILSWAILIAGGLFLVAGWFIAGLVPEARTTITIVFALAALVDVVIFLVLRKKAAALAEQQPINWD